MILEVKNTDGGVSVFDLGNLFCSRNDVVTIGRASDDVWNAIPLNCKDIDPFQCAIGKDGEHWVLSHGQTRTECPKGLRSDRPVPCNFCRGCCVNIHVANPVYFWREPMTPTLLNGEQVGREGATIVGGDVITIGSVEMTVVARQ